MNGLGCVLALSSPPALSEPGLGQSRARCVLECQLELGEPYLTVAHLIEVLVGHVHLEGVHTCGDGGGQTSG